MFQLRGDGGGQAKTHRAAGGAQLRARNGDDDRSDAARRRNCLRHCRRWYPAASPPPCAERSGKDSTRPSPPPARKRLRTMHVCSPRPNRARPIRFSLIASAARFTSAAAPIRQGHTRPISAASGWIWISLRAVSSARTGYRPGSRYRPTRAQRQHQIGILHPRDQRRIGAKAQIARITGMVIVDQVLAPERQRDRDTSPRDPLRKLRQRPPRASHCRPRIITGRSARVSRAATSPSARAESAALSRALLHTATSSTGWRNMSSGQRDHHRPHASGGGETVAGQRRELMLIIHIRHPFRDRAEQRAIIHFLERLAPLVGAAPPGPRTGSSARCPAAPYAARHWHGVAPRPARHHANAWPPGQLAMRRRHVGRPGFMAAGDDFEAVPHLAQRIQHRQIAFAGHAEHMGHTLGPAAP